MTSMTVSDVNWGERRAAAKVARWRRRRAMALASPFLLVLAMPLVAEAVNAATNSDIGWRYPHAYLGVVGVALLAIFGWVAWRNWVERDEVERRMTVNAWAAIGVAMVLLRPILRGLAPVLHLTHPEDKAWLAGLLVGFAAVLYQKVRS